MGLGGTYPTKSAAAFIFHFEFEITAILFQLRECGAVATTMANSVEAKNETGISSECIYIILIMLAAK